MAKLKFHFLLDSLDRRCQTSTPGGATRPGRSGRSLTWSQWKLFAGPAVHRSANASHLVKGTTFIRTRRQPLIKLQRHLTLHPPCPFALVSTTDSWPLRPFKWPWVDTLRVFWCKWQPLSNTLREFNIFYFTNDWSLTKLTKLALSSSGEEWKRVRNITRGCSICRSGIQFQWRIGNFWGFAMDG